jgi:hypothetical protein
MWDFEGLSALHAAGLGNRLGRHRQRACAAALCQNATTTHVEDNMNIYARKIEMLHLAISIC